MPQLSTFMELGLLIFIVTFIICYRFAALPQMLSRAFGLALFLAITGISNEQSYSFFAMSSTSLMFTLIFLLLAVTAYIPFTPHLESIYTSSIPIFSL